MKTGQFGASPVPGRRDADVGGLRLAGAVDDAAHHRQRQRLDAVVARLPRRHLLADVALDALGELLERGAGGAAAARARGDARREAAQAERLQQLARGVDLLAPIAARLRRERHADRVADAFAEEHAHRRRRPDQALDAHAGLGQPEVQRLARLPRQLAVDADQVPRLRELARQDDLIRPQPGVERQLRRLERRAHHALVDDVVGGEAQALVGVLLHAAHDQLLVEGAAVDADADRLALVAGDLADGRELLVAPLAGADVARVDPVLVERGGAGRIAGQQQVAVVVEVADERRVRRRRRACAGGSRARPRPPPGCSP